MRIQIKDAHEHNLQGVDVEIGDGLTVVTGVSGSGKTSLVFDTLYHEARRRFLDVYELGSSKGRLVPAHVGEISGLGPAVAVGQNLLNRNPASTLATASGLHPFLRLLYAHFAERACAQCGAPISVCTEDELVEHLARLAQAGPLEIAVPLLQGIPGSHHTLLDALEARFGRAALRVDGDRWDGKHLPADRPHDIEVILLARGTVDARSTRTIVKRAAALGSASLVVRLFSTNLLTPDPLTFSRSPVCPTCGTWFQPLRPVDFNCACPHCSGKGCDACAHTGLPPEAAAARWNGLRLPELLSLSVDEAVGLFLGTVDIPTQRLQNEVVRRLEALRRVGLGYVALQRPVPTLSRGEAQRVRLALTLISRLEDMLHVLDEPTVGQHPADIQRLLPAFRELAGPVVYVEHERAAAVGADRAIDIGPGAGTDGGQVVFDGTPAGLWQAETATGRYFSGRARVQPPVLRPAPDTFLWLRDAHLRNLRQIDVPIPLNRLTVITGVSGSGKSTLVEDVLVASLSDGKAVGCQAVCFPPPSAGGGNLGGQGMRAVLVDQSPIGRNPRSNPATYTKLADIIRDLFAAVTGLSPSQFSFNRPEGACPTCEGLGAIEVSMRYLPSTWIPCSDCDGARFNEEVLAAKVGMKAEDQGMENGASALSSPLSIADFYQLSIAQVREIFRHETRLPAAKLAAARRILDALCDIGLGYLELGQASPTLSGGEAQRVKLAKYLGQNSLEKELLILDEPSTGLHPQDLAGLLTVLDRLVRGGATIVIVEHNTDVMRAADWVIDLGPGAGPAGGRLLYAGPVAGLSEVDSPTGRVLREEDDLLSGSLNHRPTNLTATGERIPQSAFSNQQSAITISGARVHNLRNVSVAFPKGKLTVVTGVSGSGKSSLVHDVLEAEARRRFLETLSLYERQGTHEGPEAEVDAVSGLGVALTVGSGRLVYSRRATVGTATEIIHHLALLLASIGERKCLECGKMMTPAPTHDFRMGEGRCGTWVCPSCGVIAPFAAPRHFLSSTYAAACLKCNGVGTLQAPNPAKLIIAPEKPLTNGAMYSPGFFPNGYLGKPFNGGYYHVQALGRHFGFDPAVTPWNEMDSEAQQAFLFGSKVELTVHYESRKGRSNTYQARWPGFYGMIRDWDVGGTYTDSQPCPACGGARLRPEYLAVTLAGRNVHELSEMTLSQLLAILERLNAPTLQHSHVQTLQRLRFLIQVGLGYLHLDRVAGTLSAGEAQRIRLAGLLGSGLTSLTLLLDEPTRGLHPCEVDALIAALVSLRDEGNTVIVVEHDPQVMLAADWLIDVGPGAGQLGGQIVAQGTPAVVAQADTLTGKWLRESIGSEGAKTDHASRITQHASRSTSHVLRITGARANNLKNLAVSFPLNRLVGVCGVSGSGKSTLAIDTLGRALAPKKQTTSVAYEPVDPGEHDAIEGAPGRVLLVDQSKTGVSSPAGFLGLVKPLQSLFAASEDAQALGLSEEQLAARCSACGGSGMLTLDMAFLPDVHLPCETCRGTGCVAEAWDVRLHGVSYPEAYGLTIDQTFDLFGDERLVRPLQAARDVGLGYLVLRQPGYALSGGEAQRLKIAAELMRATGSPATGSPATRSQAIKAQASKSAISNQQSSIPKTLYLLDEPSLGQHLEDVARLAGVLRRLVSEGGSVIIVEHHPHLLAACDWLVELGPAGGPGGGYVIAEGTPRQLAAGDTPTAPYLVQLVGKVSL